MTNVILSRPFVVVGSAVFPNIEMFLDEFVTELSLWTNHMSTSYYYLLVKWSKAPIGAGFVEAIYEPMLYVE